MVEGEGIRSCCLLTQVGTLANDPRSCVQGSIDECKSLCRATGGGRVWDGV